MAASAEPFDDAVLSRLRRAPQQTRSRAKVAKVLEVADRLLVDEGVEALTTSRLAAEAGVSVGSLYQYIPDRNAIIDALAATHMARLEALMDELAETAGTQRWADPVEMLVDAFCALYRDQPGFRALWNGTHVTEETREADREHKRTMAKGLHRVLLAQGLAGDTEETAQACYAALLAADAVIHEAFRVDPQGAPALLAPLKDLLRAYLATWPSG